jgi:hypothetical protein
MERRTPRSLARLPISLASTLAFAGLAAQATAGTAEDRERELMQQQLNQQVMAAPFSVEDQARIDAYVKNAMEKDLKPVPNPPPYWRRGYTCDSIRGYGWRAYGDCYYYHRYYGRYWY